MATKKSDYIDIRALLTNYLKHWWWFVISVIICCGAAYLILKGKAPEYMVRANVQIVNDDTKAVASMSGLSELFGSTARVDDEVYIINSHTVLRDVAKKMGLNVKHYVRVAFLRDALAYPKFPVTVTAAPEMADTLMTTLKFKVEVDASMTADIKVQDTKKQVLAKVEGKKLPVTLDTEYGKFTVVSTDNYPKGKDIETEIYFSGYDIAAEDLAEDVSSEIASRKSNIVELSLKASNTVFGSDVLNNIIECYNKRAIQDMNEQGMQTEKFLEERIAMVSANLVTTETEIQNYKQGQGIIDPGTEAAYNMQLRGTAEQALAHAQTQSEIIKMTRDFLRQPQNAYELIPASQEIGGGISSSIAQYNGMIMQRMDLMQNARANNNALTQLDARIDAIRNSINMGLEKAYETSLVSINEARVQAAKAMGKLGNIPSQERQYLTLRRQQEVEQQLYIFLLKRREETAMMLANAVPKGHIVDEAYTLSEPIGMSKKMIFAIIFILALCIPPVVLYIKKLLRNKFETRKEVESITNVPILGEVCRDTSGRSLVVSADDTSSTSELFRLMRSSLQFILNDVNDKVVLVTSTRSGEGKSFISINLAASLALLGKKVLLIGMDIRNPQLGNLLGINNGTGLTNYLSSAEVQISDLIKHMPGYDHFDLIVGGPVPPNPGELLTGKRVEEMIDELRKLYDYIVVDSAPVGMVSDTFNLSRLSDATIYVCRVNYTNLRDIEFLNSIYEDKRLKKMSIVVNDTAASQRYGYGYHKH